MPGLSPDCVVGKDLCSMQETYRQGHPPKKLLENLQRFERLLSASNEAYQSVNDLNPVKLRLQLHDLSNLQALRDYVERRHSQVLSRVRDLWKSTKPDLLKLFSGKLETSKLKRKQATVEMLRLRFVRLLSTTKSRPVEEPFPRQSDSLLWIPDERKDQIYEVLGRLYRQEAELLVFLSRYYSVDLPRDLRMPLKQQVGNNGRRNSMRAPATLDTLCSNLERTQICFSHFVNAMNGCFDSEKLQQLEEKRKLPSIEVFKELKTYFHVLENFTERYWDGFLKLKASNIVELKPSSEKNFDSRIFSMELRMHNERLEKVTFFNRVL